MEKYDGNERRSIESYSKEVQAERATKGWEYYSTLIETSLDFFLTFGPNGKITDVNSATEKAIGLPREWIIGTNFSEYFTEPEKARIGYKQVFASGKVLGYQLYLKHADGLLIPVSYNASVYTDKEGQIIGALAVARDISAIKRYEDELMDFGNSLALNAQQKNAELLIAQKELAFQNEEKENRAAELLIANTELAFQNEEKDNRAAELLIANRELVFQNAEKDKRAAELVLANKELLFETGEKADRAAELVIANKELAFQNEEKDKRAVELQIANAELLFQNEEIYYISQHDFLTGLYNRMHFEKEKRQLDIPSQLPLSFIMGDVNGLKLVNDGFGHAKGDELLVILAKILKSCCREDDIVSRIGGDEFGILLPKTNSKQAQLICSRISEACNGYDSHESLIHLSISLGYATKEENSTETMTDIIKTAEENMSMHKLLERESVHSSIIASIKAIMFERSQETEEHAVRMVKMSNSIGLAMSLSVSQLNELELASTLHDIGKMGVSSEILAKPGKLTAREWKEMRKHPAIGFRIAQASSELIPIAEYILYHHERWDGKGYPEGLLGDKIPLLSRIVSLVDSYDAMTNDRPYRSAMTKREAIEEIIKNSGTQFDPEISRVFVENVLGQTWQSATTYKKGQ